MGPENINAEQVARAAAQGVAIALSARQESDDLNFGLGGPIVMGYFPDNMFEVSLERDTASGEITVKSLQPKNFTGSP
jgi:hypothetical protein